ncbi:helix-turn-helix domain-containing protein [Streptomyces himastatinicus]|nr:helix-turn-helix domain-containing protein [Streptomyces himastatinicus]
MGRPEAPLDPGAGPVQRFALELRKLRQEADVTYRVLARRTPYTVSTLSRAASGEQLPSLQVTLAYVEGCGGDPEEWERRWRQLAEEAAAEAAEHDDAEPPYQGLARFELRDQERFFGRDELIADLLELTRKHRLTALVGASGSGKSSLLRAGLIPALQNAVPENERPAAIRIFTPGPHPARTHAGRFTPKDADGDTVVVVDQFEEMFTLCADPAERTAFTDLLKAARDPGSRLRVIIAVRADFLGRCAEHRGLTDALRTATLLVGPMSPAELREAIVKPAADAGLIVERALTARLIEEVTDEPGGLPLLSHVLLETWRRRRGRALTETAYEAAGGLHGAIARTAEHTYAELTPERAEIARRVLLRLITPGEGAQDTRRPVDRSELDSTASPEDLSIVLEQLTRARLITLDEDAADLAHEALISGWPRLRAWVEENRERLRVHRHLTEAARAWAELDRDSGALYRGTRLAILRDWASRDGSRDELNVVERAFLDASVDLADSERAAAVRRHRHLRLLAAGLALLLLVVTGVSVVALEQRQDALRAHRVAVSRQLAAEALGLAESRPAAAMLLSVEAFRTARTFEARSAMLTISARQYYRAELSGHNDAVSEAAFGPDGTLATVSRDRTLTLWDTGARRRLATLTGHSTWLRAVAYSPDGCTLATGGDDGKLVLWDAAKRRPSAALTGHKGQIKSIAFSPDSRTAATAGADHTVRLWDTRRRARRLTLSGHTGIVWAAAFSPDGRTLATAGADHKVMLWNTATGKRIATLTGHTRSVDAVAFSPDGRTLATASDDWTARLWDVRRHTRVATLRGHSGEVRAVAFSPDGRTLATGGHDKSVMLWDSGSATRLTTLTGQTTNVYTLAFSPRDSLLASAGEDGKVVLWDTARIPLSGHRDRINDVAFSPDGRTLATAGGDDVVLWDSRRRTRRATFTSGSGPVHAVAFAPDGRTLATVSGTDGRPASARNHVLTFWNGSGQGPPVRRTGHAGPVKDVAYSPDGRLVATGGGDKKVILWDAARRNRLASLTAASGEAGTAVNGVAFSPDGRFLATANQDRKATLWDVAGRTRLATLSGHTGQLRSVAFSPDGRMLATAGIDQKVMLWDVAERTRVATLADSTGPAFALAFSRDGRMLATANSNKSVMLWDIARRSPLALLTGHTKQVRALAFSPDGRTLATGGDDRSVLLWNADTRHTPAQLCRTAGRNLTPQEWRQLIPGTAYRTTCPAV